MSIYDGLPDAPQQQPASGGLFADPLTMGLLGLAAGFGQAGMPSRMRIPLGAAIGMGASGLQSGLTAAGKDALTQAQTEYTRAHGQLEGVQAKQAMAMFPLRMKLIQQELGGGGGMPLGVPGAGPQLAPPAAQDLGPTSQVPTDGGAMAPADTSVPRGIRNNNPLNLSYVAGQPGVTGSDGRFGIYPSMDAGYAAAHSQLKQYGSQGVNTLSGIINRWAPPNENDTPSYVARVSRETGFKPDQQIDVNDPAIANPLMQAMARVEQGRDVPGPGAAPSAPPAMPTAIPPGAIAGPVPGSTMAAPGSYDPARAAQALQQKSRMWAAIGDPHMQQAYQSAAEMALKVNSFRPGTHQGIQGFFGVDGNFHPLPADLQPNSLRQAIQGGFTGNQNMITGGFMPHPAGVQPPEQQAAVAGAIAGAQLPAKIAEAQAQPRELRAGAALINPMQQNGMPGVQGAVQPRPAPPPPNTTGLPSVAANTVQAAFAGREPSANPGMHVSTENGVTRSMDTSHIQDTMAEADRKQVDADFSHADNMQQNLLRLNDQAHLADNPALKPGSGGFSRAAISNVLETYIGKNAATQWIKDHAMLPDAAIAQEFSKLALQTAATQEREQQGARGMGYRMTEVYMRNNPNLDIQPDAIKRIINLQRVAQQMDIDYVQGLHSFYNNSLQRWIGRQDDYLPTTHYDENWLKLRNPQVGAASVGILNGQPFTEWQRGLSREETARALQTAKRVDPAAKVLWGDGQSYPLGSMAQ